MMPCDGRSFAWGGLDLVQQLWLCMNEMSLQKRDESASFHASASVTVGYEGRVCWGSELYSLSRAACEPTSVSVSTER